MNQTQKNYAMARIAQIQKDKMDAIKKKHTVSAGEPLGDSDKIKLIAGRKVNLKPDVRGYTDLRDAFDFSKFEKPSKVDQAAIDRELAKLSVAADQVRDEIMLGDEEKAKDLIAKFAA